MPMRNASLALGIAVALIGFADLARSESVPVPRPAPLPKTGLAASAETPPRPPMPVPGADTARPALTATAAPNRGTTATPPKPPNPLPAVPARPGAPVAAPDVRGAIIGPNGVAFDAKQRVMIERVNAYLTSVQSLIGDFVQVGPDGGRSAGKFYLQKPGRIRFEYDPPSPV